MQKNQNVGTKLVSAIGVALVLSAIGAVSFAAAGAPCCSITGIDVKGGVFTAKDMESGKTFQVRVSDEKVLRGLKLGQKIDADLDVPASFKTPATPPPQSAKQGPPVVDQACLARLKMACYRDCLFIFVAGTSGQIGHAERDPQCVDKCKSIA